jgi:hypothetical protein
LATSDVCTLQFYREEPGDLGIADLSDGYNYDDLGHALPDALLSLRNDPDLSLDQRPLRARAVTEDGFTVSEIEVVRLDRVTIVNVPDGPHGDSGPTA